MAKHKYAISLWIDGIQQIRRVCCNQNLNSFTGFRGLCESPEQLDDLHQSFRMYAPLGLLDEY